MDLDFLKSLISDFDLLALLPEMATVMDWIATAVHFLVLVGPMLLTIMGLIYLLLPPKEANHFVGYRFFWGMGSVEAWRFTQRLAGIVWAVQGLILTVAMYICTGEFESMDPLTMLYEAVTLLLWQIGVVFCVTLLVNLVVVIMYDSLGRPRWHFEPPVPAEPAAEEAPAPKKEPKPKKAPRKEPQPEAPQPENAITDERIDQLAKARRERSRQENTQS